MKRVFSFILTSALFSLQLHYHFSFILE